MSIKDLLITDEDAANEIAQMSLAVLANKYASCSKPMKSYYAFASCNLRASLNEATKNAFAPQLVIQNCRCKRRKTINQKKEASVFN